MPARSVIETRIRNRLEVLRQDETRLAADADRLHDQLNETKRKIATTEEGIATLEELLAPPNPTETTQEQPNE